MQFSDTTNNLGIIQACERYTNLGDTTISGTTATLKEFTAYANTTMRRLWHKIFMSSGNWHYDDGNQTNLPQAVTDTVAAQAKYAIPSDAMTIKRMEYKDSNGDWSEVLPLTLEEIPMAVDEYHKEDADPIRYRLVDDTIELFPAPKSAISGGLKVYFDRGSVAFANTDTTKTPGFVAEYHDLVAVGASLEWLKIHLPANPTTAQLKEDWLVGLDSLGKFYNRRFKDYKIVINRKTTTFK